MISENKHISTLEHLKERFTFTPEDCKRLDNIKKYTIDSISFTTYGGFDIVTNELHSEERSVCFKVRIRYINHDGKVQYLLIQPFK